MKKYCFTILVLLLSLINVWSQEQKGYVRTAGSEHSKGEALVGVAIRAEGTNYTKSENGGAFSVMLQGKEQGESFRFTKIYLAGYELLEKDGLNKEYIYSESVPVEIVMISTEQLLQTKLDIEDKARHKVEARMQKLEDSLRTELEKQRIAIEDYRAEMDSLNRRMEAFEHLLPGMVEHYARTDYEKLDSLNREINICIVNGELEKADSLINTKGDVIERGRRNIEEGAAISRAEQELNAAKERVASNRKLLEEEYHKRLEEQE